MSVLHWNNNNDASANIKKKKCFFLLDRDGFNWMSPAPPQTSSIMKLKEGEKNVNNVKIKKKSFFPPTTWHPSPSENNRVLVENNSV